MNKINILFITLSRIADINQKGIYTDLVRCLVREGHNVYVVSPIERQFKKPTHLISYNSCSILKVKTLNIQKTNLIEKGLSTILLEKQFNTAIKKHFSCINFDLILYSTPPITLTKIIQRIKERNGAKTYLLLKDIFPQNAVDIGLLSKKSLVYKYFRRKEKKLYELSDFIGCMSPANVEYLIKNNRINPKKIEICPNSIEITTKIDLLKSKKNITILNKYKIPFNKVNFIYGGNLGKPQGIDFLLEIIFALKDDPYSHFIIVGSGTEFLRIKKWFDYYNPQNATLLNMLTREEYNLLVGSCDVGLIFLDKRFTIPNFPSRLLTYLENSLPIITATDPVTDIGKIAEENKFGFSCINGDLKKFITFVKRLNNPILVSEMGNNGFNYLLDNYTAQKTCKIITNHIYKFTP